MQRDWDKRYRSGDLPWDTGVVDKRLQKIISEYKIKPCKTIDIGCGTGTNAIWLARQGFDITGIDLSPSAIEMAKKKALKAKSDVNFQVRDILKEGLPLSGFKFVFDRGCFHSVEGAKNRKKFSRFVADSIEGRGFWFSLIGNADDRLREKGPPRLTVREIAEAIEYDFKIVLLKASRMRSNPNFRVPPLFWECLMEKRGDAR